ncbi:hypothetical protein BDV24DRAFT_160191 [Aspergillus arachidicola]|uniref:Uncharacterized protein n=1 Tax=Aspergillus arachidicola TaxID=656916 RepID=A0A5N6YK95_9EURO|nr:hypothetical protein BDV24DRAFT_160191 [Aspergillus arachidicola]
MNLTPVHAVFAISAQVTHLGMLDYLRAAHVMPDGFDDIAKVFLGTCRSLWTIEVGLGELTTANRPLPMIIVQEVEQKFIEAYQDFQNLDRIVTELIQYKHCGILGKSQKMWRQPNMELKRISESLKRTFETLKITVLAFYCYLGAVK